MHTRELQEFTENNIVWVQKPRVVMKMSKRKPRTYIKLKNERVLEKKIITDTNLFLIKSVQDSVDMNHRFKRNVKHLKK